MIFLKWGSVLHVVCTSRRYLTNWALAFKLQVLSYGFTDPVLVFVVRKSRR